MDSVTDASAEPPQAPRSAEKTIRLIATDLDGTLLRDDKTVSSRTIAALAAAERAGIEVFFVTGRPARWMDVVSDHVHGHGLAICANGAAVVDLHHGRRIVEISPLERPAALAVVHALRAAAPGTSFAVERTGGINYEPEYPPFQLDPAAVIAPAEKLLAELSPEHSRSPLEQEGTELPPASEDIGADQPVLKLLAHHPDLDPDAFLELARARAGAHASFTRSSPTALLEISGPGVSKAGTLARCCAQRGIGPDQVVAFGDMPNDLEMLAWAGTSYAMANAHPDVLAATALHTHGNNEDGVAAVIERILDGR
ncbi:hydrolase [Streptomyces sp. WAC 06725]|uniref:HAD hydrolase family protein n=1 Tax=Streptomyces sp. WAC 06725 TaxID=2203209 RepID=UPI000F746005|nr:HAD hydrolase family protein [Streptomyces sp. WAC 06725]RSO12405.1 hydrolase [Streptomyces sp. WAC 06725]